MQQKRLEDRGIKRSYKTVGRKQKAVGKRANERDVIETA
jgi:hypothetical protein